MRPSHDQLETWGDYLAGKDVLIVSTLFSLLGEHKDHLFQRDFK